MDSEKVSGSLSDLSGHASRAARAETEILKAAHEQREIVEKKMAELKPTTLTDARAAEQYEDLIMERAHIDQVIGRGRHH